MIVGSILTAVLVGAIVVIASQRIEEGRALRSTQMENLRFVRDRSHLDATERPFHGLDLRGMELNGLILAGADLTDARLSGAELVGVRLDAASLVGADLSNANLRAASLVDADLTGATLSNTDLSDANLTGVVAPGVKLSEATLSGITRISAADFSGVMFSSSTAGSQGTLTIIGLTPALP